jgi:hypothetical protein
MMNATKLSPRRTTTSRATRPVPEMLLELAYRLHVTKVVARPFDTRTPSATPSYLRKPR